MMELASAVNLEHAASLVIVSQAAIVVGGVVLHKAVIVHHAAWGRCKVRFRAFLRRLIEEAKDEGQH